MALLFQHARWFTPVEELAGAEVLVDDGRIVAVGTFDEPPNADRVDLRGLILAPGFIDIHVHGGGGHSVTDSDAASFEAYARWVVQFGVTSYLAGTIGAGAGSIERSLHRAAEIRDPVDGAQLLGIHLEGPFLNPVRRGAFHPDWLAPPDPVRFGRFAQASDGRLRVITIAPELDRAVDVIAEAIRSGVKPSLGHTDATYETMTAGFEAGARNVTHCFNGMRPFAHREPGPVAAALTAPGVFCEVIADGQHVAAGALRLMLAARGVEHTVLVTDGIQLAGVESGSFGLAGQQVRVSRGRATTPDGTLAGSVATMDACIRNMVTLASVTPREAVLMATLNPARAIGVETDRGQISPGFRADLVALTPDLRVAGTWVAGRQMFGGRFGG